MTRNWIWGLGVMLFLMGSTSRAQLHPESLLSASGESALAPVLLVEPSGASLRKGWPLVLTVHLMHPGLVMPDDGLKNTQSLVIEPSTGGWEPLLSLQVVLRGEDGGQSVDWPFRRTEKLPRRVVLTPTGGRLVAHYVLSPGETARLATGDYYITARVDTTRGVSAGSWKGAVSRTIALVIGEPSADAVSAGTCEQALATYQYLVATGRRQEAVSALDGFLSRRDDEEAIACLATRGEIAEQEGDMPTARNSYCKADKLAQKQVEATLRAAAAEKQAPDIFRSAYGQHCVRLTRQFAKGDAGTAIP